MTDERHPIRLLLVDDGHHPDVVMTDLLRPGMLAAEFGIPER